MINNGRLRTKIDLLKKSEYVTSLGSKKVRWVVDKTTFAEVKALRGQEYLESVALSDKVTYKITVRYYSSLTPDYYVRYQSKFFNIKSVIDVNNRHSNMELMCEEHIGNDIEVYSES